MRIILADVKHEILFYLEEVCMTIRSGEMRVRHLGWARNTNKCCCIASAKARDLDFFALGKVASDQARAPSAS